MKNVHIALEVSCDEHYRSAFLKNLKENWPSMAKDYRHYCHVFHPQQGDFWVWTSSEGQKFIHFILDDDKNNLLSFDERLHYFKLALKKLAKSDQIEDVEKVVIPKGSFHFDESEMEQARNLLQEYFMNKGRSIEVQYDINN